MDGQNTNNTTKPLDTDAIAAAVQSYISQDEWRKTFLEAPDGARDRLALNFYFSACRETPSFDRDRYLALRSVIEKNLSEDDLEYLIDVSPGEAAKNHFRRILLDRDKPKEA